MSFKDTTDPKPDSPSSLWRLRAAFFLATAADSVSNAFLPVVARSLPPGLPFPPDGPVLPDGMAAGLPVAVFWLAVAVAQITAGRWERGRDHRALLLGALLLSAVASALSGMADSVAALALWRAAAGFATGIVMILVQDGLLRAAAAGRRTAASGSYLGVFFAGTIAGTLVGGAVAGAMGHAAAFYAAALGAGAALLPAFGLPRHREALAPQPFRARDLLRNPPFLALVLLAAVPSRLLIAGFLYCLLPLRLHDLGLGPAGVGWVLSLYALIMALTAPAWSRRIDRSGRPLAFTVAGLLLSALALTALPLADAVGWTGAGAWDGGGVGIAAAAIACALLGTAQAIGMAPQVTLLFQVSADAMERFGRTPVLGLFRVFERLGLFAGPLLAGALTGGDADAPLVVLALLAAAAAPALALALSRFTPAPRPQPDLIPVAETRR